MKGEVEDTRKEKDCSTMCSVTGRTNIVKIIILPRTYTGAIQHSAWFKCNYSQKLRLFLFYMGTQYHYVGNSVKLT